MEKVLAWLHNRQNGSQAGGGSHRSGLRTRVTLSYAQSLDGSLTTRRGESTAISGRDSLQLTHALRAAHTAILVGSGTVLADNPRLTVRLVPGRNPRPIVLDSRLRISPEAAIFANQPWIATTEAASEERRRLLEAAGARVLRFPSDARGWVPFASLLERLGEMGVPNLMVEGGARVIAGLLACGLADDLVLTIAPVFVGGLSAVETLLPQPFPRLAAPQTLQIGEDVVVFGGLRQP